MIEYDGFGKCYIEMESKLSAMYYNLHSVFKSSIIVCYEISTLIFVSFIFNPRCGLLER